MSTSYLAKPEFEQGSTKDASPTHDSSAITIAAERAAARQHLPTPNSSPTSRALVDSLMSQYPTHLPTPQSSSNKGAYASIVYDQETPTRHKSQQPVPPESIIYSLDLPHSPSFLTPESSPLFARKGRLARPFRTPSPKIRNGLHEIQDSTSISTGSYQSGTSPPISRDISPSHSGLSSPFQERRSQTNGRSRSRSPLRPSTPKRSRLASPMTIFSSDTSMSNAPLSLRAPIPQRPVVGEIERIGLQLTTDQTAQQDDIEARRPDYLRRLRRPSPSSEFDFFNSPPARTTDTSALGVIESPVKGRRITLFQATSEETFEQSLSESGFRRYGATPAYSQEPQTPEKGKSQLSQRALDWLQQATPGRPVAADTEHDEDWVPSEREMKKRKRLAAFESPSQLEPPRKLYAVEIEGKGRVLVDQPLPLIQPRTPPKQKGGRKRKGRAATPAKKAAEPIVKEPQPPKPNWLDSQFPWAMRNKERSYRTQKEHEERLKWIERFLDRSSSDEEDEDQSLGPSMLSEDTPMPARGRGKMVPFYAKPDSKAGTSARLLVSSDPADARAALLSKRSVRSLAFRKRLERAQEHSDSDEEVVCICNGTDDGRELVQCDDCHTWYHLECIGINDVSELGREEDPWYCAQCLGLPSPTSNPTSEPTFVEDESPMQPEMRDPLFFQGSPTTPFGAPRPPKTPTMRGRNLGEMFSARMPWDSQAGPSTPQNGRSQHTPNVFGFGSPFDPTSTPSRGMQFSGPFATPKIPGWTSSSGLFRTPTGPSHGSRLLESPTSFHFGSGKSPQRTVYSFEETPVRRSKPRPERSQDFPRTLEDSPLGSRSVPLYPLGLQESPLMGMGGRKTRNRKGAVSGSP